MATLKDVAKETGLTVSTVSRVLNNRGYISADARERVYEAMKRLNYQPNELARSLSKQTTNTIGVIVPHIDHPYFARLLSSLETAAYKSGYKLLLFNSGERDEKEDRYLEMCKGSRVAGWKRSVLKDWACRWLRWNGFLKAGRLRWNVITARVAVWRLNTF